MKLVKTVDKILFCVIIWGILFSPIFACRASSGLESVWAEEKQENFKIVMPINTEGLAELGTFLIYVLVMFVTMFAFIIVFMGGVKLFLASGNEDVIGESRHALIAGIVSFVLAMVLFFSLDQVFSIVRELASKVV